MSTVSVIKNGQEIVVEDAKLIFRNFSGRGDTYNREGSRSFCLILDTPELYSWAEDHGWPIKHRGAEGEEGYDYIKVEVSYKFDSIKPLVVFIKDDGNGHPTKTQIDENGINVLDWTEIIKADIMIRNRKWKFNNNEGFKPQLSAIYATLYIDPLEAKYGNYFKNGEDDVDMPFDV